MNKIFSTVFFCLITLLIAPTSALAGSGQYGPYDYVLSVNVPQIIPNLSMWSISAECTIISDVPENIISIKALYKKGSVNDIELKRGDIMVVSVEAGEILHLKAESGARVELNNEGTEEITARCYASFYPKNPAPFSPLQEDTSNL